MFPLLIVALGCGGGGTLVDVQPPKVRSFNASPNSNTLTFAIDNGTVGSLTYLGSSSGFSKITAGDRDVSVVDSSAPETEARIVQSFVNDAEYLLIAYGLITPPNTELSKRMDIAVVEVDRDAVSDSQSRVVVVNAFNRSAGWDNPRIDFRNPGDLPQFKVEDIAFGEFKGAVIDAGVQTFVARFAGEDGELTPHSTFTFLGGKTYLAIVGGIEGDATTPPVIRFVLL